ncbi:MAG: S8 family serine peptidase [Spiribacter salinus]|uniref:S8 family serine peptidase n=1 Tax=Spiribacter salinus TaxID=1335746 RepID=A0A540VSK2_9GAMM|nr:MAG: S8 family serine peptidase [Spiribacter salinus]TQE99735.1 MAG: S8 family serine peptidase [Spiribacter salinus]
MEDAIEEAAENEVEDAVEEAVENEVEDEAEEAVENEVEDEAEESAENEVEDEAEESAENEVEDEAAEAAENEVEEETEEPGDDGFDDFGGSESEDYEDGHDSKADISGQIYAELEEIGERDFVVHQELLALADAAQIQQLADITELTLISKHLLGQLTGTLARFRVGANEDIDSLRSRLQRLLPSAAIDYNHGYEIAQATSGHSDTANSGETANSDLAGGLFRLPSGNRNAGLKIGMIDTAVDNSHSVFADTRMVTKDFLDPGQQGSKAHGTAVASLLVGRSAEFQGMFPNTDLYAASVFSIHPEKALVASSYSLVRALEWLSEVQVDAINISLAGPANEVVGRAMASLTDAGVLVVAAVGNEGPFAEPRFPAAYRNVAGVTAIDRSGRLYSQAGRGEHVDYAGPGVGVTVARQGTLDGYEQSSGTSFATPIVTGLLLRYLSAGQTPVDQLDSAIGDDFVDLGQPGRDALFGHGLPGRTWIPEHLRPSE